MCYYQYIDKDQYAVCEFLYDDLVDDMTPPIFVHNPNPNTNKTSFKLVKSEPNDKKLSLN